MTRSKWSAKRHVLSAALGVLLVALLVFLFRSEAPTGVSRFSSTVKAASPLPAKDGTNDDTQVDGRSILTTLKVEARRMGQVDENPQRTQDRLHKIGSALSKTELILLADHALDTTADADERFLAAYLLAETRGGGVYEALNAVAGASIDQKLKDRQRDIELEVRAQAIEGLGKLRNDTRAEHTLKNVALQARDSFLRDRAQRSLYEWRTGKPVEEQDRDALEKLLEKADH